MDNYIRRKVWFATDTGPEEWEIELRNDGLIRFPNSPHQVDRTAWFIAGRWFETEAEAKTQQIRDLVARLRQAKETYDIETNQVMQLLDKAIAT